MYLKGQNGRHRYSLTAPIAPRGVA
jgi:hypothetical protein